MARAQGAAITLFAPRRAGLNASASAVWLEPVPPAVQYLQQQPDLFRVVGTQLILNPNMAMLTGLEDVRGYDPLAVKRYNDLLSGLDGYAPAHYHNYFRHLDDPRLDLLNATYGLSRTPPSDPRWEPVFDDPSGVTVYRSRTVLPRAYVVYDAQVVENAEASLARTLDLTFDPRQSVILEQTPLDWTPPASPPTIPPQVKLVEHDANHVTLNVVTDAPGLLVLTDTYLPGWRASVGGQPTPLYIANHAFRAVMVPAGTHSVTFTYAPASLRWGVGISGAALVVLVVGALWARRLPPREFAREELLP